VTLVNEKGRGMNDIGLLKIHLMTDGIAVTPGAREVLRSMAGRPAPLTLDDYASTSGSRCGWRATSG